MRISDWSSDVCSSDLVERNLALAILASSPAPALLLDGDLTVIAGSTSFYRAFGLDLRNAEGRPLFALGAGEWDVPQLRSLLSATLSGHARIEAYRSDARRVGKECVSTCRYRWSPY